MARCWRAWVWSLRKADAGCGHLVLGAGEEADLPTGQEQPLGPGRIWQRQVADRLVPFAGSWPQTIMACFGGLAFLLFLLQILSGLFLLFHYQAEVEGALSSVLRLESQVPLGWVARRLHAAGGHLLALLVMLHMLRVLLKGAYQQPRRLHWLSGCLLFWLTMLMLFTGSFLPQNHDAVAAVRTITGWLSEVPLMGPWLLRLSRGGAQVGQETLSFYYALHLLLPFAMGLGLAAHFAMVRASGVSEPL